MLELTALEEIISTGGVVAFLLIVVWKLADKLFAMIPVKANPSSAYEATSTINARQTIYRTAELVGNLHDWHKPDPVTGRMGWKDNSEVVNAIEKMGTQIVHELKDVKKAINGGVR